MKRLMTLTIAALALAALGFVGCGDDDGDDNATTTTPTTTTETTDQAGSDKISIEMGDFFFKPSKLTVPAGEVTISARNVGKVEHELVLLDTDQDPAKLKTKSNGEVDEDAYKVTDELEAEPGDTAKKAVDFTPGKYAMICNLPGHYKSGMYGSVTAE